MDLFIINEADNLARKALSYRLLSFFYEARILGEKEEKKLVFFFKKCIALELFERAKNEILARLRAEYKKRMKFYKKKDFIFYGIEAKNVYEIEHRSKEEIECLNRGLARLERLLKETRERRRLWAVLRDKTIIDA